MITLNWIDPSLIAEYAHLAFLAGVLIGYLYFRRTRISIGGTLAVGYLAASLINPLNTLVTVLVSVLGYAFIRLVVLRVFLPRPRQIFAIGMSVGIGCGALWILLMQWALPEAVNGLSLVGVVVPGMLCNSLTKQGLGKTLIPLVWMVPLSGAIGLVLTLLAGNLVPVDQAGNLDDVPVLLIFAISALSVFIALAVQERTSRSLMLRSGGYVTAGLIVVAAATEPIYLPVLAVATLVVVGIFVPFNRSVPLFGKDRFILLLLLSFTAVTVQEIVLAQLTDLRVGGPESVVFCILPAIIANDLVQYGVRRTAGGLGLTLVGCAAIAAPLLAFT